MKTPDISTDLSEPTPDSVISPETDREIEVESPSPAPSKPETNDFITSLRHLNIKSTNPLVPRAKKGLRIDPFLIVRILLLFVCFAVLLYTSRLLIEQAKNNLASLGTYGELSNRFWSSSNVVKPLRGDLSLVQTPDYQASQDIENFEDYITPPTYNEEFESFKAKLGALKALNPEIYGYLYIEGTSVDYPLVQHADNDYYLNNDFMGKYSTAGAIFVDYRNKPTIDENRNTVIYGHHMYSGSTMFHTLDYFFDEEFFNEHEDLTIYTFDGIYHFKIFATSIVKSNYHYTKVNFPPDGSFVDWCNEMEAKSLYHREGLTFDRNSHIVTLSTCTNINKNERICVQAVLVEVER